ncbi:efflux RND transporter periplasmic adaptor subunit [Ascidiimonas sp. W6]|uniref:efflux RND transporter periplasmic adaptor subunit n=1 Tax=Ascidiimonas meishanensis TaxID=3128903 RepID=UPI0030EBBE22
MITRIQFYFLFSLLVCLYGCNEGNDKILPEKSEIIESVYASVIIQPDSLYEVYAAVGGILEQNLVAEGDLIVKNKALMQILNTTPKLNMENARLTYELSKERYDGSTAILAEIEDEISAATLKYKNDSINYFRQKNLWEQRIGSQVTFDTKKLAYELSENSLELLKSKYDRTQQELETQLKQASNNYKTATIASKDFTVTSKISGKVYSVYKNPGEIVSTREPLALIGSANDFVIEMLVDEVDIVKIRVGQATLISLDAYNSKVFEAKVSKIYPRKDERTQTFKIEAEFITKPAILYPGLAGEGNVIIAKRPETLSIPKDYLIEEDRVLTQHGIKKVVTGLQTLDRIEILEGIDENTYILKPEK